VKSVQENVSLSGLTTLGIGGPARQFVEASTEDEVLKAVRFAREAGLQLVVIGGGSNLLVSDVGFSGLVVRVAIQGVSVAPTETGVRVGAGAGVDWDGLVSDCVARNLSGVECLSGIPGLVGGTPVQNVGAYGQEVSDVISSVRVYDQASARITDLSPADCGFGYRTSVFNTTGRGRYIVTRVTYLLEEGGPATIGYSDLERYFQNYSGEIGLGEVREAVLAIRASKAMLLVDGDPDCRSAGSFFKNPVVSADSLASIRSGVEGARIPGSDETVPSFPLPSGDFKIPAAWLIERAGFARGTTRGRVGLSGKHTLALINRGGASSADVLSLVGEIQDKVQHQFDVRLRPEPLFLGFDDHVLERFGAMSAG
jgi:UDP-N-acetylmuramate dehydrogenase